VSLFGASFDCAKASNKVEKMICANPVLSTLDENLSKIFKEAVKATDDKEQLKKEQFLWIKERDHCKENICVQKSYKKRISELNIFATDEPKSKLNVDDVDANIVSAYLKALCYHRSNAVTYQIRYISADEGFGTETCSFANGKKINIDYSGDEPYWRGECGATPEVDFSLLIGKKRVISKEVLTQRCKYESAIKSIKIQDDVITTCVYATTGEGVTLTIDKNKVSCSSKIMTLGL
jgi:uncharacterized protein YecT (DUF1311 family)